MNSSIDYFGRRADGDGSIGAEILATGTGVDDGERAARDDDVAIGLHTDHVGGLAVSHLLLAGEGNIDDAIGHQEVHSRLDALGAISVGTDGEHGDAVLTYASLLNKCSSI